MPPEAEGGSFWDLRRVIAMNPSPLPTLLPELRPAREEVELVAALILELEHGPPEALPNCEYEAEMQLWAVRCAALQSADGQGVG